MVFNLKKIRFLLLSMLLIGVSYYLAFKLIDSEQGYLLVPLLKFVSFISILTILSSTFIQYLEGGDRGVRAVLYVGVMPLLLVMGSFFFYLYYPNVSLVLKVLAGLFYTVLLYTLLLLNNVLLVVGSRESNIPVYRVATNWVQIVLLSTSISLFIGLFRIQVHPLMQIVLVMLTANISYNYLLWVYSSDKEIRSVKLHEGWILSSIFSLIVGWGAFTTLFFPAESFLRGIFTSSVFLLGLGYIQLYLKNSLSKRNIRDYILICLVFLAIVIVFRP